MASIMALSYKNYHILPTVLGQTITVLVLCPMSYYCIIFLCQPSLAVEYSDPPLVAMKSDPLNKIHLVVAVSEFPTSLKVQRNATGNLISLEGVSPLMLDWMSLRYKFNYSILDINAPPRPLQTIEAAGPNNPGFISYVVNGECDGILAVMKPTPDRSRRLELVHPWFHTPIAFLIPIPEVLQNNVDAVIKPFQLWVWIMLIVVIASVIFVLLCINWILKKRIRFNSQKGKITESSPIPNAETIYMYIVSTLLNQGGYISSKLTPIRLVVGAWCLLTLVLLNVYNGILISYVTATQRAHPLINTVDDVAADPNILLVLNRGLGADVVFSSAEKGLYKVLGDKLRSYPKSRCNSTQQCVDLVKSTPHRHVYLNGEVILKSAIQMDYKKTGQCKMTIAAKFSDGSSGIGWGLAKKSPYLEIFNRGTLELLETGLISLWVNWFEPNTRPCWNNNNADGQAKSNKKPLVRLSLTNLTGAFVVLAVGCLVSILAFLIERIVYQWKKNQTRGINIK